MKVIALFLAVLVLVCSAAAVKNDVCALPHSVIGPCRMMLRPWTYLVDSNKCIEFTYGGCKGNENRFDTQAACEDMCKE